MTCPLEHEHKISRETAKPRFVEQEQSKSRKYPHRRTIEISGRDYVIRFRRSRWSEMGSTDTRSRKLFAWVSREGVQVAALEFHEFEVQPWVDNQELLLSFDDEASLAGQLAELMVEGWEWPATDVMGYGNVVELRYVWTAYSAAAAGMWATVANMLVDDQFPEYALMALKAFPLEYEGSAAEGSRAHVGLRRRQLAMLRHYHKLLGVKPFPSRQQASFWMFKINPRSRALIDEPFPHRERLEDGHAEGDRGTL